MLTRYVWDYATNTCLAEVNEQGETTVEYTVNPQTGELISERRDGEDIHHRYDGDGNTRQTADSDGNVLGEATYDAFGETVAESGDMKTTYRFQGQRGFSTDPLTGVVSKVNRNYSPSLGRRLSLTSFGTIIRREGYSGRLERRADSSYKDLSGFSGVGRPAELFMNARQKPAKTKPMACCIRTSQKHTYQGSQPSAAVVLDAAEFTSNVGGQSVEPSDSQPSGVKRKVKFVTKIRCFGTTRYTATYSCVKPQKKECSEKCDLPYYYDVDVSGPPGRTILIYVNDATIDEIPIEIDGIPTPVKIPEIAIKHRVPASTWDNSEIAKVCNENWRRSAGKGLPPGARPLELPVIRLPGYPAERREYCDSDCPPEPKS